MIQAPGNFNSLHWVHNASMPSAGGGHIVCDVTYGAVPTLIVPDAHHQQELMSQAALPWLPSESSFVLIECHDLTALASY